MKRAIYTTLMGLIYFMLISATSYSQIRESGTIHGNVRDEQGTPLPGATVTISGPNLMGGEKTYISDKNGYYRFPSLPIGPYTVFAELSGFTKVVREVTRLSANMSLAIDMVLKQTTVNEVITVTANPPTIDIKSSAQGGAVMTNEFLMNTPIPKSIVSVVNMAPGTDGEAQSAYGSSIFENTYTIDGIDITGTMNGGTSFRPDYNIFEEAEFQGLGLPAEYGEFTGGFINTVTKSGSNTFSGLAEVRFNGNNWNSQNNSKIALEDWMDPAMGTAKYQAGSVMDFSLQFGGKIIRDKLWFFVSGAYLNAKTYPAGMTGHSTSKSPRLFSKFNFQINKANRITAQFIYTKISDLNSMLDITLPEELTPVSRRPGLSFMSNWTSILSQDLVLEAKFGYFRNESNLVPHEGLEDVPGGTDLMTGYTVGNWTYCQKQKDERYQGIVHLSYYVPNFLFGSHDIKLGGEIQHSLYDNTSWSPGNFVYYTLEGEPLEAESQAPIRKDYSYNTLALFLQDSWTIGRRLTVNAGLRYNRYSFNIPVEGKGNIYKSGSLAPRIGITYDILGDRKNVLKFHYGQYFSALKANFFRSLDDRGSEIIHYLWNGTDWEEYYRETPSATGYSVDPKTKQPYQMEVVAGFERELFKNASLEFDVFYRKGMRFIGAVRMNGEYELIDMLDKGPDGRAGTADDSTFGFYNWTNYRVPGEYLITNPVAGMSSTMLDDPKRMSKGFEIIFQKRMSHRWQLYASYNYSITRANTQSLVVSGLGTNPNQFTNAYSQIYSWGEPHHFKVQGSVILPLDINLGIYASIASGKGEYATASYRTASGITSITMKAIGDAWKYDTQKNVDLRLEKRFSLGEGRMVTVMTNIYNVFNRGNVAWRWSTYGSLYGKIYYLQDPRRFEVSARFWF